MNKCSLVINRMQIKGKNSTTILIQMVKNKKDWWNQVLARVSSQENYHRLLLAPI